MSRPSLIRQTLTVTPIDHRSSLVERRIGGALVWSQAFASDHIDRVLDDLQTNLAGHIRPFDPTTGRPA